MIRRLLCLAASVMCAALLPGQGLFRDTTVLDVTIATELKVLIRDRDSTRFVPHAATLTYRTAAGESRPVPITLRARGHFRRQARNCDFPPLKFAVDKKDARETLFQGNSNLKITTNCRPASTEYEQYVLSEYLLYRAYQAVSPRFFRTRLARITYHDRAAQMADVVSWAFFIEDDKEVAQRYGLSLEKTKGALFRDLDPDQLAVTSLFEHMAANTDWSISGQHNIALMRDSVGSIFPVAYDFDWSGAVNARYSFPDARLNIKQVTERLYRGPCKTVPEWQPTIQRFVAARPRIEALYAAVPAFEARRASTALSYFADFYKIVGDPKATKNALVNGCLPDGN